MWMGVKFRGVKLEFAKKDGAPDFVAMDIDGTTLQWGAGL